MNGVTGPDIKAALRKLHTPRYNGPGTGRDWVLFDELRTGTNNREPEHFQSIDMWAMYTWTPRVMIAYEVKVSRADFRREVKAPTKRKLALFYSNRYYFATPQGLIDPGELPPECGLIELMPNGRMKVNTEAPWRECHPPSWHFVGSIARRVAALTHEWGPSPDDWSEYNHHTYRQRSALQEAGWKPGQPLPPAFLATFER